MTIDNLRILVRDVFERTKDVKEIETSIFSLLRLFEMTYNPDSIFIKDRHDHKLPDKVPYYTICTCNPTNGGNGICGCVIGNQMISNPITNPGTIKSNTTNII